MYHTPRSSGAGAPTLFPAVVLALTALLLPACLTQVRKGSTEGDWAAVVEPDGWWEIQVPRRWRFERIEVDGARTSLSVERRRRPDPASSPLRDPLAVEVVYVFSPPTESLDRCPQPCPAGALEELAIVARPAGDESPAQHLARALDAMYSGVDTAAVDVTCAEEVSCAAVELRSPLTKTLLVMARATNQARTYQLKASAPLESWPEIGPLYLRAISTFRPLRPA